MLKIVFSLILVSVFFLPSITPNIYAVGNDSVANLHVETTRSTDVDQITLSPTYTGQVVCNMQIPNYGTHHVVIDKELFAEQDQLILIIEVVKETTEPSEFTKFLLVGVFIMLVLLLGYKIYSSLG